MTLNHSYSGSWKPTHESISRILEPLPVVTETRTFNLTSSNLSRLTAEEKRIASDKGWTLAP